MTLDFLDFSTPELGKGRPPNPNPNLNPNPNSCPLAVRQPLALLPNPQTLNAHPVPVPEMICLPHCFSWPPFLTVLPAASAEGKACHMKPRLVEEGGVHPVMMVAVGLACLLASRHSSTR
jgi:hypothetical protein